MKRKISNKKKVDRPLLIVTIILLVIGVFLVFSSSWPEAVRKFDNGYFFLFRHLFSLLLGSIIMIFAMNFNYKRYKKLAIIIMIIGVVLNLLLFTELGKDSWGSTRWLKIGFLPRFMPSDVLKVASIIFMAFLLDGMGRNIRTTRGVIISLFFMVLFVGIVFIRDMGSSVVILGSLGLMLIAAGMKVSAIIFLILLGSLAIVLGLRHPKFKYRIKRLSSFRDPMKYKDEGGWQLINSIYGLAMGGLTGVGLGKGVQKFTWTPNVYNDFIFSVIAEEFGFIGSVIVVGLYLFFVIRCLKIASNIRDKFGKFLIIGLSSSIVIQAFIHIAVNIGIAPVTGITLPFISYGGTSLIISMFSAGIILNISKYQVKRRKRN